MRNAYRFVSLNIPSILSIKDNQYEWIAKSYIKDKRNTIETLSVDVQMQTLCCETMNRFHNRANFYDISNVTDYQ
jgi:cellulose synthase/poly-beta-1,6-N-acetylglucosamine synthase-like glycosyltransferase